MKTIYRAVHTDVITTDFWQQKCTKIFTIVANFCNYIVNAIY